MTDTVSQRPTRHRRVVMLMIFVCVAITFLDRGNISLTAPLMGKELGIDAEHMGWILSGFSWTYALFQIPSGWLVDRIRPRFFYPAILILWSVATVFLGVVGSFIGLFPVNLTNISGIIYRVASTGLGGRTTAAAGSRATGAREASGRTMRSGTAAPTHNKDPVERGQNCIDRLHR